MMEIHRHIIVQVKVWIEPKRRREYWYREPERLTQIRSWLHDHNIQSQPDRTGRLTLYGDYVYVVDDTDLYTVFALPVDLALLFKLTWGGV